MMLQSKKVLNSKGQQYHICCGVGDVGRYVILPGDPFRTDIIAKYLDDPKLVAHNREHKTWTGYLNGVKVSVTSTGMGGPSTAIAVEELIHLGADTFIRVGTCGRVCEECEDKSFEGAVITGAIRDEGTTVHYIPIEYPAIADRHIVAALSDAAKNLGWNYVEGIAQSKDSFYGELNPESMPIAGSLNSRWEAWKRSGVIASEMETAALFVVSAVRGVRAGAIMAYFEMGEHTINVACEALKTLIAQDQAAGR
jgi:uridine phosphorylase